MRMRAACAALALVAILGHAEASWSSESKDNTFPPEELIRRTVERRAVEAVIWGMPVVNYDLMLQEMIAKAKGLPNQIVYWSRLLDWKNQTLTPNPDSIYLMPFFNTKDVGPVVIEIPPADDGSINGTIMDVWQAPLEDVGPAGVDKGRGGKYLILPPGYKDKAPDNYIVLPSQTYQGYALLRSMLKSGSDEDVAKAVAYGLRIKIYPLSQAANPPPTRFLDANDVVYDATIPYDMRFFQSLNRIVQQEPWIARDRAMIDMLKSIGIDRGKPFDPDQTTQASLNAAIREAKALLEMRYNDLFASTPPYFDTTQWVVPALPDYIEQAGAGFSEPESYAVNDRGLLFTYAFFTPKHLGDGQFYLMAIKDKEGRNLSGANTYRLTVPENAPVKLYWSVTAYDRATHALIRDQKWSSRSSQNVELQKNADGSVDVYFGPQAPPSRESNWVPTNPAGDFELLFRFYGPERPLFDKTWKLPDIEKVAAQ